MKLNYRGDQTNYDPIHLYGPDQYGAVYRAKGAVYDAAADRTTISFEVAGNIRKVKDAEA